MESELKETKLIDKHFDALVNLSSKEFKKLDISCWSKGEREWAEFWEERRAGLMKQKLFIIFSYSEGAIIRMRIESYVGWMMGSKNKEIKIRQKLERKYEKLESGL